MELFWESNSGCYGPFWSTFAFFFLAVRFCEASRSNHLIGHARIRHHAREREEEERLGGGRVALTFGGEPPSIKVGQGSLVSTLQAFNTGVVNPPLRKLSISGWELFRNINFLFYSMKIFRSVLVMCSDSLHSPVIGCCVFLGRGATDRDKISIGRGGNVITGNRDSFLGANGIW